uniref:Probable transport protein n=1 Tax=Pseudochloris wilhelmii TaxID=1418016 RepID=A0A097KQN1_9CHLO|nr:probable transport protein [Pseudochloris wilhelmii]AIT95486.1 probable transport protein [Pseudochloris wilhelmii]
MSILIENISKTFSDIAVLKHINIEIKTGSLVALIGPSGSGKSTLLRIIAGLEKPNNGRIWLHGYNSTNLSPQERELGFVFQNYALFPNLTVYENICFGLSLKDIEKEIILVRMQELLRLVQLEEYIDRYPYQLSGGQCQRVAFARALALEPRILLLDEPFAALDAPMRKQLRSWIRKVHKQLAMTTVFVTHDHHEAFELADDIVILENARIAQLGTPQEIIEQPANSFVRDFIKIKN